MVLRLYRRSELSRCLQAGSGYLRDMDLQKLMRRFPSEESAANWIATQRWPEGPVCHGCGVLDEAYRCSRRAGLFSCAAYGHQFSVTAGTPMHGTHLPLRTWGVAMYLIVSSSKGVSAMKLKGWLGVTYKTAWHMGHRIRAMMAAGALGEGLLRGIVELDETYVGGRPRKKHREADLPDDQRSKRKQGRATEKPCVFVAVERGGRMATRIVPSHTAGALGAAVRATVDPSATLLTDELPAYVGVGREYADHQRVRHSSDEYVRTCGATGLKVHVNTAESWNATLKRAIVGVFHRVSRKHLHRYAAESAFRWNERVPALDRIAALLRVSAPPLPYRTLIA